MFRRKHKSARRSANVLKHGLSPRQLILKAEREARRLAELDLFYEGREARHQRMSRAGFRNKRHIKRKLRQFASIRAVMRQGYGRTRR